MLVRVYEHALAKGILCGRELWAFDIRFQNNLMSIVTQPKCTFYTRITFYGSYLLCGVLFFYCFCLLFLSTTRFVGGNDYCCCCCWYFLIDAIVEKPFFSFAVVRLHTTLLLPFQKLTNNANVCIAQEFSGIQNSSIKKHTHKSRVQTGLKTKLWATAVRVCKNERNVH